MNPIKENSQNTISSDYWEKKVLCLYFMRLFKLINKFWLNLFSGPEQNFFFKLVSIVWVCDEIICFSL